MVFAPRDARRVKKEYGGFIRTPFVVGLSPAAFFYLYCLRRRQHAAVLQADVGNPTLRQARQIVLVLEAA